MPFLSLNTSKNNQRTETEEQSSKRRRIDEITSSTSSSAAIITPEESTPSLLPNLPNELWVKIFNFTQFSTRELLKTSTQSGEWADMPQQNLRRVSKRFLAIYDSMLRSRFLATFQPAIYDDSKYQLQVHQVGKPNRGEVHLTLEDGVLHYNLQTLEEKRMQGVLDVELNAPLSQQAISDCKDKIHCALFEAVKLQEHQMVKARLIDEMKRLLEKKAIILESNEQLHTLQRHFARLEELNHGGWLSQELYLLEIEHHLEQINTEIVQEKVLRVKRTGSQHLKCGNLCLTRFPKTVLVRKDNAKFWAKLETLFLDDNQLQSLPAEIEQLVALKYLYLNNNHFQTVPAQIWQLVGLRGLNLNYNQLQSLPVEIGQCRALEMLYLGNNQLQSVPAEIGQLVKIGALDLSYNQLQSVPAEIGQLVALRELYLANNHLRSLPAELNDSILYISANRFFAIQKDKATILKLQQPFDEDKVERNISQSKLK